MGHSQVDNMAKHAKTATTAKNYDGGQWKSGRLGRYRCILCGMCNIWTNFRLEREPDDPEQSKKNMSAQRHFKKKHPEYGTGDS